MVFRLGGYCGFNARTPTLQTPSELGAIIASLKNV